MVQRRSGRLLDAETTVSGLLQRQPDHSLALECKVGLASERKNWQQAAEAQRILAEIHPDSSSEQCRLGDLQLRGGDKVGARSSLLKGLQLDPYAFLCHRDLGELERTEGRITDAVRELEWVARYFPEGDPKTYVSLALAYQKAGKHADAQQALEMGKRVFASDPLLQKFSLKTNRGVD
jgi:predicted Zn-dependent protease